MGGGDLNELYADNRGCEQATDQTAADGFKGQDEPRQHEGNEFGGGNSNQR